MSQEQDPVRDLVAGPVVPELIAHQVAVIIPVRDDPRLRQCLAALAAQTLTPAEVIVVDNGSARSPADIVADFPGVRLIAEPVPGSYRARNAGVLASSARVLAFTDSDCLPTPQWLAEAVTALGRGVPIVAGRIEVFAERPRPLHPIAAYELGRGFPQQRYVEESGWCATANMVTTREWFEKVGPFNDLLQSGGDSEWGRRATASGLRLSYEPTVVIRHPARATFRELYSKLLRTRRGQIMRDVLAGSLVPYRLRPRDLVPPMGSWRRAKEVPGLQGIGARLSYLVGEVFVRYAGTYVAVRATREQARDQQARARPGPG